MASCMSCTAPAKAGFTWDDSVCEALQKSEKYKCSICVEATPAVFYIYLRQRCENWPGGIRFHYLNPTEEEILTRGFVCKKHLLWIRVSEVVRWDARWDGA